MARTPVIICTGMLVAIALLAGCGGSQESRNAVYSAATDWTPPETAPRPVLARPKNTTSVGAHEVVELLDSAGLRTKQLGPARLSADELSRLPAPPRSAVLLRVSDGRGSATRLTFVEFGSWRAAAQVDARSVNGFAARNWLVLGSAGNDLAHRIAGALEQ